MNDVKEPLAIVQRMFSSTIYEARFYAAAHIFIGRIAPRVKVQRGLFTTTLS